MSLAVTIEMLVLPDNQTWDAPEALKLEKVEVTAGFDGGFILDLVFNPDIHMPVIQVTIDVIVSLLSTWLWTRCFESSAGRHRISVNSIPYVVVSEEQLRAVLEQAIRNTKGK